jgi:hypothetical protein
MDENLMKYGQQEFNLPHDVVKLPSEGKFYKSKKKSVKVGYLTAADENTIMASNGDDLVMSLLRSKVYEPDLRPEDMLNGDIEALLIFLRNTSFGPEYTFSLSDPSNGKSFETTIVLDELNIKQTQYSPDSDGTFTTTLPKSGDVIKLKPLNYGELMEIDKMVSSYPPNRVAPKITWRLNKLILEINGSSDREMVSKYVDTMPILDSKYIRKFMSDNLPSLDLKKSVIAPSGEIVETEINFGVEFFRPFF